MSKPEGKFDEKLPLDGKAARAGGEKGSASIRRRFCRALVGFFLGLSALVVAAWAFFPEQTLTGILAHKWYRVFPAISLNISTLRPTVTGLRAEGVELGWKGPPARGAFRAEWVTIGIAGFQWSSMFPRIAVNGKCGTGRFDAIVDPGLTATTLHGRFSGCRIGLPRPVMGTDSLEIENGVLQMTVSGRRLKISSLRARLTAGAVEIQGIIHLGEQGAQSGRLDLRGTLAFDPVSAKDGQASHLKRRLIRIALAGSLARPILRILPATSPAPNKSSAKPPSTPVAGGPQRPDKNGGLEHLAHRFRLVGTVTGTSTTVFAIIEDRVARTQGMFRMGDRIGGGVLNAILRDRVEIAFGHRKIVLMAGPGDGGDSGDSFGEIPLAMTEVEGALSELGRTLAQVRIRARTGDGPDRGVEIVDVVPGSIYDRMGIRAGDIVQSVNGTPIENPALFARLHEQIRSLPLEISVEGMEETVPDLLTAIAPGTGSVSRKAAELAGRIRTGDPIALTIRRDGKSTTLSYRVTP